MLKITIKGLTEKLATSIGDFLDNEDLDYIVESVLPEDEEE